MALLQQRKQEGFLREMKRNDEKYPNSMKVSLFDQHKQAYTFNNL